MKRSLAAFAVLSVAALAFGQHSSMPPGMSHEEHMKMRGDATMGFDQDKVSHHFHLTKTGGNIELRVNSHADAETLIPSGGHLKNQNKSIYTLGGVSWATFFANGTGARLYWPHLGAGCDRSADPAGRNGRAAQAVL